VTDPSPASTNPTAPGSLRITETFFSIQGESTHAGLPCFFIRLAGCHLRCRYCDTEYAFKGGETRTIDDLLDETRRLPTKLVQVTGGEPLLQTRVHDLMSRLCDEGYEVLLETSGACDVSTCDPRIVRILDLKTPGSGESERNLWSNLDVLTTRDEVKFVICDRTDYEWARDVVRDRDLTSRCGVVLFSPAVAQPPGDEIPGLPALPPRDLVAWILDDRLTVRLQLQLHKFIWDPQTRGV